MIKKSPISCIKSLHTYHIRSSNKFNQMRNTLEVISLLLQFFYDFRYIDIVEF